MIKIFFHLFILCLVLMKVEASTFKAPDIYVDSKLDINWSEILLNKVRTLMKNYGYEDPLKSTIHDDLVLTDSLTSDIVPEKTAALIKDIGDMIGLKLINARTKVVMSGFSYDIPSISTDIKTQKTNNGIILSGFFFAKGVKVTAKEIKISIQIPVGGSDYIDLVNFIISHPKVAIKEEDSLNFSTDIKVVESKDSIRFQVLSSSFKGMVDYFQANLDSIDIDFGDLVIPNIDLMIGKKKIHVSSDKIESLIAKRQSSIKSILADQFVSLLNRGIGGSLLKLIEDVEVPREHWLKSSDVQSQIVLGKLSSALFDNNLEVSLPGDFCTKDKYDSLKSHCVQEKKTQPIASKVSKEQFSQSVKESKEKLLHGESNFVASVSEDYINKLLVTTYDAGFWNEFLKSMKLELGPKKAFVLLDEAGESGKLYMDLVYTPSKFQGFLLGRKRIRFPLIMKVALRIESKNNIPVILIKLNDIDLRSEVLLSGIKEDGLESSIQDLPRFKKLVVKTIQKEAQKAIGTDVISLPYKELQGLGLENVVFQSDGEGRMSAFFKIEDQDSNR